MVRFRTFRKALKHIKKINITDIQTEDSFSVEKAVFDTRKKEYAFLNADGIEGVDFVIRQRDISLITRKNTDDPDNEFVFLINTRDGKQYGLTFFMENGYSFFVADKYTKENVEAIVKAVPKYLCSLKNKQIRIRKSTNHEAFSTWNDNADSEDSVITETFFIDDFDYEVKVLSGLPVIHFIDKCSDVSAKALGVEFIVGDVNDKDGVVIGTSTGEYILTTTDLTTVKRCCICK